MASVTGDFVSGVEESCRVLGAVGRVLPATKGAVVLKAQTAGGEIVGQVNLTKSDEITTVSLVPPQASPPPAVLEAIAEADQIVLGPGSLFTSVLAVLCRARYPRKPSVVTGNACLCREPARATARNSRVRRSRLLQSLREHDVVVDVVLADRAALALGAFPDDVALVVAELASAQLREHDPKLLGVVLSQLVAG